MPDVDTMKLPPKGSVSTAFTCPLCGWNMDVELTYGVDGELLQHLFKIIHDHILVRHYGNRPM
jgi:hypothetical protein